MFAELQWIHSVIRSDLEVVREMAGGHRLARASRRRFQARLRTLAAASPLWQLRINCLHYCRFVHSPSPRRVRAAVFPELRRSNPALGPVVDKLQADGTFPPCSRTSRRPPASSATTIAPAARGRLVAALGQLSTDLLAHLAYEEESIGGTLRTWTTWPYR